MWLGYLDESGKQDDPQHKCISFGGYLGPVDDWPQFEAGWRAALDAFGVPYFHMREFNKERGVYAHLSKDQKAEFLKRLVSVIAASRFKAYGAVVRLTDLDRFNAAHGLKLDAYSVAVYSTLLEISLDLPGIPMKLWVDHFDRSASKLRQAEEHILSDVYYPQSVENYRTFLTLAALPKTQTFREVLPVQAADFAAWELRKLHYQNSGWFEDEKPGVDANPQDWLASLQQWQLKRDGQVEWPVNARKSFRALSRAVSFEGSVWDTHWFEIVNKARNGIWYPGGASSPAPDPGPVTFPT
jgi:hypothetical protein